MRYTKPQNMGFHVFFSCGQTSLGIGRVGATIIPQYETTEMIFKFQVTESTMETKILHDRQELSGVGSSCCRPPNLYQVYQVYL